MTFMAQRDDPHDDDCSGVSADSVAFNTIFLAGKCVEHVQFTQGLMQCRIRDSMQVPLRKEFWNLFVNL